MLYHTGEKPFQCKVCEMKFISSSELNDGIHTGLKPYKCEFYEKEFRQSGDLKKYK